MRDVHIAFGLILLFLALLLIALEYGLLLRRRLLVLGALAALIVPAGYIYVTSEERWDLVFDRIEPPPASEAGGGKARLVASQTRGRNAAAGLDGDDGRRPPRDGTGPGDGAGGRGEGSETAVGDGAPAPKVDEGSARKSSTRADEGDSPASEANDEIAPECDGCPRMVIIKAGTFTMGARRREAGRLAHEGPTYRIEIENHFAIGKYEVTRAQFHRFVTETGHRPSQTCVMRYVREASRTYLDPGILQDDDHPAVCVSWNDAVAFTAWLTRKTRAAYRLPTEAEWEYAARAGSPTLFPTGDTISPRLANFLSDTGTVPVGTYAPNDFGVHDMAGNVWELVANCWQPTHQHAQSGDPPAFDLQGLCTHRVMRGGAWYSGPRQLRSAARWANPVDVGGNGVGFRVARNVLPGEVLKKNVASRGDPRSAAGLQR